MVGLFAWLSTEHLWLTTDLIHNLATKWAWPYRLVASVGPIALRLELLPDWKIHDVFHALQLHPAVRFNDNVSAH